MNKNRIILLIAVFVGVIFTLQLEVLSITSETKPVSLNGNSSGSVTGTGKTYQEAFKDARNKMPKGKSWYKATTNKKNGKYHVTLYYK